MTWLAVVQRRQRLGEEMNSKVIMLAIVSLGLVPGSACAAAPSDQASEQAALSQCVALKTSGADRILTA